MVHDVGGVLHDVARCFTQNHVQIQVEMHMWSQHGVNHNCDVLGGGGMSAIIYSLLACLNASLADRSFRKGRVVFGLVATAACAFSLWMTWLHLTGGAA